MTGDSAPRWGRSLARLMVVASRWSEIVGEALARTSRPVAFRGDVLVVEVDGQVWMQELARWRREILERLVGVGCGVVRDLRLIQGRGARRQGDTSRSGTAAEPIELDAEARRCLERALEKVVDPELRTRLESLFRKASRRRGNVDGRGSGEDDVR